MNFDEFYKLDDEELILAKSKNADKNKLGFAVLLKHFQLEGHYPKQIQFVDPILIKSLASQLNVNPSFIKDFN